MKKKTQTLKIKYIKIPYNFLIVFVLNFVLCRLCRDRKHKNMLDVNKNCLDTVYVFYR